MNDEAKHVGTVTMIPERVSLNLKHVVFRSQEYRSLEEYLVKKCHFNKIKERAYTITKGMKIATNKRIDKTLSLDNTYESIFLDAALQASIIGEVIKEEDILNAIDGDDSVTIYTARYQMITMTSSSGYSIQRFMVELIDGLGLDVMEKEWIFTRVQGSATTQYQE